MVALRQPHSQPFYPRDHWFSWLSTVLLGSDLAVEVIVYLYADGEEAIRNGMSPHPPRLAIVNPDKAAEIAASHGRMDMFSLYRPAPGVDIRPCLEAAIGGLAFEIVWWLLENYHGIFNVQETDFLLTVRDGKFSFLINFMFKHNYNPLMMSNMNSNWWRFYLARHALKYDRIENYWNLVRLLAEGKEFFLSSLLADLAHISCVLGRLDWLRSLEKADFQLDVKFISKAFVMGHMKMGRALMKHYVPIVYQEPILPPGRETFPKKYGRFYIDTSYGQDIHHSLLFHLWDVVHEGGCLQLPQSSDDVRDARNVLATFVAEHALLI